MRSQALGATEVIVKNHRTILAVRLLLTLQLAVLAVFPDHLCLLDLTHATAALGWE
jgi:hypothetical protein